MGRLVTAGGAAVALGLCLLLLVATPAARAHGGHGANGAPGEEYTGLFSGLSALLAAGTPSGAAPTTSTASASASAAAATSDVGEWAPPVNWPLVAVHAVLQPTGRVLVFDAFGYALGSERLWNPATGAFTSVPYDRNLFCSGHVLLADGRTLVVGGHVKSNDGLKDATLFDPATQTWTRGADMARARWYPTATTLGDGRVLVVSGDNMTLGREGVPQPYVDTSNTLPEVYDPNTNTWTQLTSAQREIPLYPLMFVLPDGRVFDAGPDTITRTLDVATGTWSTVATSPIDGGSAVMYRPGKILKTGRWGDAGVDYPADGRAAVIDMNQIAPAWREVQSMGFARSYHNLIPLPDGNVLAVGGGTSAAGQDPATAVLTPELWNPDTETWTQLAPMQTPRLYHSTSLLLPDGRILVAGGGRFRTASDYLNAEIYSPPYLFKGARPTITSAPGGATYGTSFTVSTPEADRIASVSLIRIGSMTHAFDENQRFIRLGFTKGSGSLSVQAPANGNVAPPGHYMLFVVDDNGVPSVAATVRLTSQSGDVSPPTAATALAAAGGSGQATLSWTAATDDVGVVKYHVHRGTTAGFTPTTANRVAQAVSTSYADEGLDAGTYYYRVTAEDAAGNVGPASNEASATVTALPEAGLVAAYGFDEGAGTSVADATGTGNGGTISGAAWAASGRYGKALSFDGVDDWVTVADSTSLDLSSAMTLEAWVKPAALGTKWRTLLFKEQSGNLAYGLYANRNTTVPNGQVYVGTGAREANGSAALPLDAWTHLAATYDGAAVRLYVNGAEAGIAAATGSIAASSGPLRIGGNGVWPEWFQGLIDEVRVYNRALSPSEIQADMVASVNPQDTTPPGAPINLAATGSLGQVSLAWLEPGEEIDLAHYNVHRGTSPGFALSADNRIGEPTGTSYVDSGVAAGTYYYVVTAEDTSGNVGPPSNEASGTATADTTGPTVSVTAPAASATLSGTVTVGASASDDVAVGGVQFLLDGAALGPEDATAPYEYSWDTRTAANGAHQLSARARDTTGNTTTSAAVGVTVDNGTAPPPGLVAAYGFDEGAGTTLGDLSGSGNNGTISGANWTAAGKYGAALSFDGANDWVTVADSASLDLGSAMTLEAWVKPAVLGTKWRTVLFKEQSGNLAYGLYANRNTSVPVGEAFIGGSARAANGTAQIPLDAWTHLAATYDGNALRLYVNGTQVGQLLVVGSIAVSTGVLRMGGNGVWPEWFQGLIDEVRVYNRALSATEIQADMTRRVGTPDTTAPSAPSGLTATGSIGQVSLSWTAATDDVGVDHYDVHRGTSPGFALSTSNRIAQPSGTTYVDSGVAAGTYYYRVTAVDAAGNVGSASNEATGTATSDTTAPSVSITSPATGATVSNTIDVKADASDDVAVAGVQFKLGSANLGAEDTTAPYQVSWNTRDVANGEYTLAAVARDTSGNPRTSGPVTVTVENGAEPPPPGLVAAYSFDEGAGTTVADVSGANNTGTISGASWTPGGKFGSALSFDGVNDWVTVADSASLDATAAVTLEAWVKPTANGTKWRTVLFKEQTSNLVYGLYGNSKTSVPVGEVYVGGKARVAKAGAGLPLGTWTHLATTYDGAVLRLYVNGAEAGAFGIAGTIATSTGPLRMGGNGVWPEWFQGLIDEVRVYDRALTTAEIQADMTRSIGTPDTEAPSAPTGLTATGALGQARLSWTAATDNVGVSRYDVHRSTTAGFLVGTTTKIGETTTTSYTDNAPAGVYFYRVVALDAAGNPGPPSNEASATVTADTTAPTVAITSPTGGSTVSGTVTLKADATDDVAVAGVRFKVDGADVGSEDTSAPYEASWDTLAATNGTHRITAVARDASTNTTTSAEVQVTVDNSAPPPPPDLMAAYGFDEAAGTTAGDQSGNGNNGTLAGPTWNAGGKFGSALSFDGVDDIVNVADSNSLDLASGMTLMAWVRATALGTKWRTLVFKERTGNLVYAVYANRNTTVPIAELSIGTSVKSATGTASLPLNTWAHVAATYDGAAFRLYVDGTLVATTAVTGSMTASTGALRIGGNAVWGEYFQGLIDEVRIYNRALSTTEIQADMGRSISIPDTEAPTAPTGLGATGAVGKATLAWTAATDNVGVKRYNVHRSSTSGFTPSSSNRIGESTTTGYVDAGAPAGTHYYKVTAEDQAGNVGLPSNEAGATVVADTTAPNVSLTAPAAGSALQNTVTVSADATDDVGVASVEFRVDGAAIATDTSAPWSASWNTRTVSNAEHGLTAVARDASGNPATSAEVRVTVDNSTAPVPGLVGAWSFDENTGTSVADASGNGNAGTVSGAVWTPGKFGSSLDFDGVNDWVTVADSNSLDATTGVSVEAYVLPLELGTNWRTVLFKERSSNLVYGLYGNRNTTRPNAQVTAGSTVQSADGSAALPLGAWTHLAMTYDGAALRLYVDGTLVATRAAAGDMPVSTGALRIGGNAIWPEWFRGRIDEVRVYNRALSQTEIQTDMTTPVQRDTTAPTVSSTTPAASAIDVSVGTNVSATFNEAMSSSTITTSTFELRDSTNALVPAGVSYNATTSTATLDPTGGLSYGATYTATVKGGSSGVKDVAGNAMAANRTWSFTTEPPPPPIAVIGNTTNRFSNYPAEILRAEGLNAFTSTDVSLISPGFLGFYDVVVLGEVALTPAQVTALSDWVTAGGNLIALRPDKQLAGLLGLTDAGGTLAERYLQVDTATAAGAGIVSQSMQYHGAADRYTLNGASQIAALLSDRTTAAGNPAVTLRNVGSAGGQAAAFAYDLARSIVYMRQGNPAWAGQDRDGINPIRPNDLFYGGSGTDPQPDWIDTSKIAIPQADEQQRLFANLVTTMARDRKPLPRFWYFPRDEKAVIVMTGDDHANGGTAARFDQYEAASPAGCSVVQWECVRGTSYIYPNTPLSDAVLNGYETDGFEVALHVNASGGPCGNWAPAELEKEYTVQLRDFGLAYPSLDPSVTERTHCVAWSDWATQPKVQLGKAIRLDTNYYHYPGSWIGSANGFMTGSGVFMRFADLDGTQIDVFQAHTQLTDESGQTYPAATDALLDKALGVQGYYGYFVTSHHTDFAASQPSDATVASALARGVPVVTAKQAYDFWNGRDKSYFNGFSWSAGTLTFNVRADAGAVGLRAMLPTQSSTGTLGILRRDGTAIAFTTQTVKGISYAVFPAIAGTYTATYGP